MTMSVYFPRRLRQVFGAELSAITHADVEGLVAAGVTEAADLDFKRELYGNNDKAKRDLCGDVAAQANSGGGLIVLGVDEDDQARASTTPGVDLSDTEVLRIRTTVADNVHPLPRFDIVPVEGLDPGRGFLLIAVPPSTNAPHAVEVNGGLRFPRRHGASTIYLSEAEVAAAYRDRFAGDRDRADRAAAMEAALVHTLDIRQAFAVVTLVPDIPGSRPLDTRSFQTFRNTLPAAPRVIVSNAYWARHYVRSGRFAADGNSDRVGNQALWLACELGQDGSGSFAATVGEPNTEGPTRINDEYLTDAVISGLRFLANHARAAATGGGAVARVTVHPVSDDTPALMHEGRSFGYPKSIPALNTPPVAEAPVDLDNLADSGRGLVTAAHMLLTPIVQGFGLPEVLQVSSDGRLRPSYWSNEYRHTIDQWTQEAGVETTDATVG